MRVDREVAPPEVLSRSRRASRAAARPDLVPLRARGHDVDAPSPRQRHRRGEEPLVLDQVAAHARRPARRATSEGVALDDHIEIVAVGRRSSQASRTRPPTANARRRERRPAGRPGRAGRELSASSRRSKRACIELAAGAGAVARRRAASRPRADDHGRAPRPGAAPRDLGLPRRDDRQRRAPAADRQGADPERSGAREIVAQHPAACPGGEHLGAAAAREPRARPWPPGSAGAAASAPVDQIGGGGHHLRIGVARDGPLLTPAGGIAVHAAGSPTSAGACRSAWSRCRRGRACLDRAQIGAPLQQVAGERVTQHVGRHAPLEPGRGRGPPDERPERLARERTAARVDEQPARSRGAACRADARRADSAAPTRAPRRRPARAAACAPLPVQIT